MDEVCVYYTGSYCHCSECIRTTRNNRTYAQTRKFGAGGSQAILDKTNGHCWYCGVILTDNKEINNPKLSTKAKRTMFTIDHIVAMAKGGSRGRNENLVPCCNYCNNLKGSGDYDFLRMQLLFIKNHWPTFSHRHYEFLIEHGINLAKFGKYVFYFEEKNLLGEK